MVKKRNKTHEKWIKATQKNHLVFKNELNKEDSYKSYLAYVEMIKKLSVKFPKKK